MVAAVLGLTSALIYITGTILYPFFITFIVVSIILCHQIVNNYYIPIVL